MELPPLVLPPSRPPLAVPPEGRWRPWAVSSAVSLPAPAGARTSLAAYGGVEMCDRHSSLPAPVLAETSVEPASFSEAADPAAVEEGAAEGAAEGAEGAAALLQVGTRASSRRRSSLSGLVQMTVTATYSVRNYFNSLPAQTDDHDGWCQRPWPWYMKRIREDGLRAAALAKGPQPQYIEDPGGGEDIPVTAKYWGISKSQLRGVLERAKKEPGWNGDCNAYEFVEKFVKPWTRGTGRGLALNINKHRPLEVNLMISHAWGEKVQDFFDDVLEHMLDHEVAYICFLANYQGSPEEVKKQLGNDINTGPFAQVVRSPACLRLLVIPCEALKEVQADGTSGLYSRLWCDLEIKVAADEGKPIHIPTRNSNDYLFGKDWVPTKAISKNATCSNPKDKELIQKHIETPVETGRSHAMAVCVVSVLTGLLPLIFTRFLLKSVWGWTLGMSVGVVAGVLMHQTGLRCYRRKTRVGYEVLDGVIKGAARGHYAHRRARATNDLGWFFLLGGSLAFIDFIVRWQGVSWECAPIGIVEGFSLGLCLYPVVFMNRFGTWTGVYIARPRTRRLAGLALLCCCLLGGLLDAKLVRRRSSFTQSFGRGMTVGWMFGLLVISLVFRSVATFPARPHLASGQSRRWFVAAWAAASQWWHTINLGAMFGVVVYDQIRHQGVSHEVMLLLLGFGALQVRMDWDRWRRAFMCVAEAGLLVGLFYWSDSDNSILLPELQRQQCGEENVWRRL